MKKNYKLFKSFLLSNQSNFISHSISKLHNTYINSFYEEKQKFFFDLFKKILFFFDGPNKYPNKFKTGGLLIISNIISNTSRNNDIYFGELSSLLSKQKIQNLVVYRNLTNLKSSKIKNLHHKNSILLSKSLKFKIEISILFKFLKETLLFLLSKKYITLKNNLTIKDFRSILSNLRLAYQLSEVLKIVKPKYVIFTFEGHAWERLLIYLCKKHKAKTIAYQFSILKKNQIGFFRKLKVNYNPDYIATSGSITYKILKNKIKYANIFKLGSPKYSPYLKIREKKIDMLVALDNEKKYLNNTLNFCTNFASNYKNFNIVLRPHPILNNDKNFIKKISIRINKLDNMSLSKQTLEKDLSQSNYLLFSNSAITITGLNYNVIPLFFSEKFKKNFFDKNFPKKYIIRNYKQLNQILKQKKRNKLSSYFKTYKECYFEKYNTLKLGRILNNE